ncbi:MAG: DMT family transporter [Myxococcota bacterium]
MAHGAVLAILAAILFGVTTPLVKQFGAGVGAFATATLLYAGAALAAVRGSKAIEAHGLGRSELSRIALVAVLGAMLAPASLAWGLQHSGALAGSLLLNLEAVFTVLLARVLYRESLSVRVGFALVLMLAGGSLLAARARVGGESTLLGLLAVAVATLGWALDNALTRPLADFDARAVVLRKASFGAVLSLVAAAFLGENWPTLGAALALLVCGAVGYGASLHLYLSAQRRLGAARTGSLFALAPFVGAAIAFAAGDREAPLLVLASTGLFCAAVYLHVTERHEHVHRHEAIEHEHAHRHDDGHHTHTHDPPVSGEHTHRHKHEAVEHEHPHGDDLHHRHEHD